MKNYTVRITRETTETVDIEVAALDPDEAKELALRVSNDEDDLNWQITDTESYVEDEPEELSA